MVKKRASRRISTAKGQPTKSVSDESDASDTTNSDKSQNSSSTVAKSSSTNVTLAVEFDKAFQVKAVEVNNIERPNISDPSAQAETNSPNRTKNVTVVSRVVTRSRKVALNDNSIVDKVTTVGVIKSTAPACKNTKKKIDEVGLNSDSVNKPSPDTVSGKVERQQSEDEDPCLSGDIMFEQVIEEVVVEDQSSHCLSKNILSSSAVVSPDKSPTIDRPSVIESPVIATNIVTMKIDSEPCGLPSSSSDYVDFNCKKSMKERAMQSDDFKVTSSCADSSCKDQTSIETESNEHLNKSSFSTGDSRISLADSQNIAALSSLKLDPETEPVSSSKTDSCFDPLFAIEEPVEETSMDVDTIVTETSNMHSVSQNSLATSTQPGNTSDSMDAQAYNPSSKKKTKGELKLMTGNCEVKCDSSLKRNKVVTRNCSTDSNDSDMPLVVNRCITETRKYTGPKGVTKNSCCVNSDSCDTSISTPCSHEMTENLSEQSGTSSKPTNKVIMTLDIKSDIPSPNDKNGSMSPKETLMKNCSSQNVIEEDLNLSKVEQSSVEVSTEAVCLKEIPDKSLSSNNISNKTPTKNAESDQNLRRSRRNSAEKPKRVPIPVTSSVKEKKESLNKGQSSFDSNCDIKNEKQTRFDKNDGSGLKGPHPKTPTKGKSFEKTKKDIVTMSSILNEKSKPMSPKELIKKSFIANESRSMDPPKGDTVSSKSSVNFNQSSSVDSFEYPDKNKLVRSNSTFNPDESYNTSGFKTESQSSQVNYDVDKPVKVKSRWRRTSELEMGKIYPLDSMDIDSSSGMSFGEDIKLDPDHKPLSVEQIKLDDEAVVNNRLKSFIHINNNEYLTERYISKETKRMLCDCTLTKEEISKGEKGCGEDCLNRLLLIECGSRCPLGKLCSNKCFENRENIKCNVINMQSKGVGVVASENIPGDRFLMEYVGEVIDSKEFNRRAKEYAKEKKPHFYFMSLKANSVIDATYKGSISRFINHSCDPNAETQKWTVNGELRIGFFSKRPIALGEEITFDYQLERYGKEAQKCYCGSANCRGWLGEDPDEYESDEDSEESDEEQEDIKVEKEVSGTPEKKPVVVKIKKEKRKSPTRRKEIRDTTFNPDGDVEDEIDKLTVTGIKNQKHTLALSRLIVRATEERSRTRLLDLIKSAATPCLRLFLDYHGLNLLCTWMVDPRCKSKLKAMIMETLFILPIQNKTILQDSKVLSTIEKWANDKKSLDSNERSSLEEEYSISSEDFKKNDNLLANESEISSSTSYLMSQASKLLDDWGNLKEEFRIPRKQRVERMKEHEREANMEYMDPRDNQSYNRRRFRDRKESRFDKGPGGPPSRFDDKKEEWSNWQNQMGNKMSKTERRQAFALKVKKEEREKKEAEELWISHKEQCKALGVNPSQTAMFHPRHNALAFYHRGTNCWMPYQEGAESYNSDEEGGAVVNQPPPPYQLDPYQQFGGPPPPGYFPPPPGFQPPPYGQFFFQPPPPNQEILPPHQGPPLPPHQGPPLPPHQGPPLPPHPGPPLPFQPGPPLGLPPHVLPPQGALMPPGTLLPPHGPPLPHGPLPPQHFPGPFPPPSPFPSPSPHQGPPTPLPPGPPIYPNNIPPASPHLPLPSNPLPPQFTPVQPQIIPPLPEQPQQKTLPVQPSEVTSNSMEVEPVANASVISVPLKLPPKWKAAKDKEGRLYYYHVKKRISQWMFPYAAAAASFNSDPTSDSSSDDSSSTSSDEEDEEEEDEEQDSSDVEQENNMMQNELDEADQELETCSSAKKRKPPKDDVDSPSQTKKSKESSLVSTIIIPREDAAEMVGISKKKIRDNKEKVKREKARAARKRQQAALHAAGVDINTESVSAKCEADTSSGPKRKIKEIFMLKMANVVVQSLNQYRKHDCKIGRITSTKDFKSLAKKLTHFIMVKELRHCMNIQDLECNDNVKHKARDFIKKYMSKFGPFYVNTKED